MFGAKDYVEGTQKNVFFLTISTQKHQWTLLNNFTKDTYPPQVWSWLSTGSSNANMYFF